MYESNLPAGQEGIDDIPDEDEEFETDFDDQDD